ncbi:MAG TPA: cysteine desulfurase-like protein, partial [Gemmataceae bacterium]|nr:cysteine desulfurase-like protein [Gemmataceae bacterium]
LDGPGGSQVPRSVIDAVADCLAHRNANDGGAFATSRAAGEVVDAARGAVADLIGAANPDEVVFGPNMTTLTFALSRALAKTWRPGDEIVVTRLDHDANVTPWVLAAADAGATVRFLDIDPADCTLRLDLLPTLLNERTKLVAVGLASNAVGTVNPVREVVAAARGVGALVFVDAVHAVPHRPVDVVALGADFLACSPYKFFGPHAGVLWGHRDLLERLPAYKVRPAPDAGPGRWMTGTPSFEAIAGTHAAVDYLASLGIGGDRRAALAAGYAMIRAHETALAAQFLDGLARLPGWRVWGIADRTRIGDRVPTFGLTHRTRPAAEVARTLGEQGLFVWSGHFYAQGLIERLGLAPEGVLRIGCLHYNTAAEVARTLDALAAAGD